MIDAGTVYLKLTPSGTEFVVVPDYEITGTLSRHWSATAYPRVWKGTLYARTYSGVLVARRWRGMLGSRHWKASAFRRWKGVLDRF